MVEEDPSLGVNKDLVCRAMRAPNSTCSYSKTASIAKLILLIATLLARTCTAALPAPPSPADKWLYPDVNTDPTYNYLDTVNASWTSNFVAPYLLLRCEHPSDTTQYAYPYNQSVSATGSALVPLDDGNAWVCHFEVSDLKNSNTTPPTFISNDFNIVINNNQKPVLWTISQDGGDTAASNTTSTPTTAGPTTPRTSASSTPTPTSSITKPPSTTSALPTTPTTSTQTATSSPTTPQPSPTSPTPSTSTTGLSKSKKIAIIVGATMGALLFLVIALAVLFILRTRRSEQNVVYRSGAGNGDGGQEVPGLEAPRERWKGVEVVPGERMQGYF